MKAALLTFFSFIFSAMTSWAQSIPQIDHLIIDDPSGRLTIFGNFGTIPGTITVDSTLTPFEEWSSDSIVCVIPDTGAGSCGPVQVVTVGGVSNPRLLSAWNIYFGYAFGAPYGDEGTQLYARFRLDLIRALTQPSPIPDSTVSSSSYITYTGPGNGTSITYDTTIHSRLINIYLRNRNIDLGFEVGEISREAGASFDQRFNVTSWQDQIGPHEVMGGSGAAFFIPPDSELNAAVNEKNILDTFIHPDIYPQPANNLVSISYTLHQAQPVWLKLFDELGKEVGEYLYGVIEPAGANSILVNTNKLPSGCYTYCLVFGNDYVTCSITVIH